MRLANEAAVTKPEAPPDPANAPVVLEVRDVGKRFRIPENRIDSLKERAVHPFARTQYRELQALDGVSFDVHRGEFLGIVGRNGSGKSTLLKILASIYRADAGTIRLAGRLAPFIELGVGFDPDLSASENVILNAVMMGLTPAQARERIDAVFAFAELEDFTELKLKNYSSGMTVRLAFSVMLQADADILLIDEVLAVGDASFQQKCADVFKDMRRSGKTVVLVTHDMFSVQSYCHRALLLHDGKLVSEGEPEEIGRQYIKLNFSDFKSVTDPGAERISAIPDLHSRLLEARLEDADGNQVANVEEGEPIHLTARIEALHPLGDPAFAVHCTNAEGVQVYSLHRTLPGAGEAEETELEVGEVIELRGRIDNPLTPGRYFLKCWITSHAKSGEVSIAALDLLDFVVYGTGRELGVFYVDSDLEVVQVDDRESGESNGASR